MEARSFDGAGRIRFLEINGVPFFDEAGKKCGYRGITRDITERKKAEGQILVANERLQYLLSATSAVIYTAKVSGDFGTTFISENVTSLVGYKPQKFLEKSSFRIDHIHPDDVFKVNQEVLLLFDKKLHAYEYRFKCKDGTYIWMRDEMELVQDQEGNPLEIVGFWTDVTERQHAQVELEKSKEKLRNLAVHLQSVREKELSKIAGDIHDDLAQSLTALKMDMVFLSRKMPESQKDLSDKLKSMIELSDDTIQTARSLCAELRPSALDDLGLADAVRWYVEDFSKRTGIRCDVSIGPEDFSADKDRDTAVFRILQETLTNVALHAEATMVKVELRAASSNLELEVKDNGKGITRKQLTESNAFGLIGIRERVKALGGEDRITGVPGKGTAVKVRIPLLVEN